MAGSSRRRDRDRGGRSDRDGRRGDARALRAERAARGPSDERRPAAPAPLAVAGRGASEPAKHVARACENPPRMDPSRKRKIRLAVALGAAVFLAAALVYTSFSASTEASKPSQIEPGRSYEITGKVVKGSISRRGDELRFRVRDRDGRASVPVTYSGVVPDPFREGREVIVSGELKQGTFVAERDSLVTKCPSKFTKDEQSS